MKGSIAGVRPGKFFLRLFRKTREGKDVGLLRKSELIEAVCLLDCFQDVLRDEQRSDCSSGRSPSACFRLYGGGGSGRGFSTHLCFVLCGFSSCTESVHECL